MPLPARDVLVFPGQGAYRGDVLESLAARSDDVRRTFAEIDEVATALGAPVVSPMLLGGRAPDIDTLVADAPEALQLAIFGTSYSLHHALLEAGVRPVLVTGHSLGEITALVAGGAFTLRQGAELVLHRNAVLRSLAPADGAMVALSCDRPRAEHLLAALADPSTAVAVENGPAQTVVSGPRASVEAVVAMARAVRVPAVVLKAPWAFHSPQLAGLVTPFADRIRHLSAAPPTTPVFSPTLGRYYRPDDDVSGHLARCLVVPVRWGDAIQRLHESGATAYYECSANDALSQAVRRCLPSSRALSAVEVLETAGSAASPLPAPVTTAAPAPAASVPAQAEPVHASSAARPSTAGPATREALLAELAALYADALEYPIEVLTEDVALEADLGIDSVKQTELLARAADRYGLPEQRPAGFRLSDHDTLGKVVDHVWSLRDTVGPAVVPVGVAPVQDGPELVPPPDPASAAGPATREALLAELAALYADALEYPIEVLTEDVALEADLGIDSVKQTELLARAADRYGLPEQRPAGFRLSDHDTLGKVVDHVWSLRDTLPPTASVMSRAAA